MVENRVCFSVRDEFGAQLKLNSETEIPREELERSIDKDKLLEMMCLDQLGYTGVEKIKEETIEAWNRRVNDASVRHDGIVATIPDDDVVQAPHCKDCPQWKPNTGTSDDSGGHCFGHDPCSVVKPKKGEQNNE